VRDLVEPDYGFPERERQDADHGRRRHAQDLLGASAVGRPAGAD
jgi:hypothetical protein